MNFAPLWKRCVAFLIDLFLLLFINILAFVLFHLIGIRMQPGQENPLISILLLLLNWFYFAWFEASSGQASFGKKMLHLQVVDLKQEKISFLKATQRFILSFLTIFTFFIGFWIALRSAKNQAIHDKFSGTCVIVSPAKKESV